MAITGTDAEVSHGLLASAVEDYVQPVLHLPGSTIWFSYTCDDGGIFEIIVYRNPEDISSLRKSAMVLEIHASEDYEDATVDGDNVVSTFTTQYELAPHRATMKYIRYREWRGVSIAEILFDSAAVSRRYDNQMRAIGATMLDRLTLFQDVMSVAGELKGKSVSSDEL